MSINIECIKQPHRQIFNDVIYKLQREHNINAVIGFGSYFEYSGVYFKAKKLSGSDIDLIVLSDAPNNKIIYVNNTFRFEIRHFNKDKFKILLKRSHVCFVPQMANGSILYDPKNLALNLKELACSIYTNGPPFSQSGNRLNKMKVSFISILYSMENNIDDLPKFHICFNDAVRKLYSIKCIEAHIWENSSKNMLRHMKSFDIDLYNTVNLCYLSNDLQLILSLLKKIAKTIIREQPELDLSFDMIL